MHWFETTPENFLYLLLKPIWTFFKKVDWYAWKHLRGVIHFKVSILRYSTRLHFKLLHDTMVLRGDWLYKSFWQDSAIDPHSNQDWFKTDYKISALPINLCLIVVSITNMDWSGHGQKPGSPSLPTTCTDSSPPLHIFHGQAIMARNQQVRTFPSHYRFFPGCT